MAFLKGKVTQINNAVAGGKNTAALAVVKTGGCRYGRSLIMGR